MMHPLVQELFEALTSDETVVFVDEPALDNFKQRLDSVHERDRFGLAVDVLSLAAALLRRAPSKDVAQEMLAPVVRQLSELAVTVCAQIDPEKVLRDAHAGGKIDLPPTTLSGLDVPKG